MSLTAEQFLRHLDDQHQEIEAVVSELDECQIAFNGQYDLFRQQHDAHLARLTEEVLDALDDLPAAWRGEIEQRVALEREQVTARRTELRDSLIPALQAEADRLLQDAQAELARVRALNPQLDAKEERLKEIEARLKGELDALNQEIRQKGRGLGVVTRFRQIHGADKERAHILGRLETIAESLRDLREEWATAQQKSASLQQEARSAWQAKNLELARLQEELDGLDDEVRREALVWRRAVDHVLDNLKEPVAGAPAALQPGLGRMIELNVQTDDYHAGLAGTAGLIATLTGVQSGLAAIHRSVEGLRNEQQMHSAYLKALSFRLPDAARAFDGRWAPLVKRFADEKEIAAHPRDFLDGIGPLQDEMLSPAYIEIVFEGYGEAIQEATKGW